MRYQTSAIVLLIGQKLTAACRRALLAVVALAHAVGIAGAVVRAIGTRAAHVVAVAMGAAAVVDAVDTLISGKF
jgi:hypothetical protein